MRKYNQKLIDTSKKISQDSLRKSEDMVYKLTNPSNQVRKVGSAIGKTIGVGLICGGTAGILFGGGIWAVGSIIAGVTTVGSNIRFLKK